MTQTNTKLIVNDFLFNSDNFISNNGLVSNYNFLIKNFNSYTENSTQYKNKRNMRSLKILQLKVICL